MTTPRFNQLENSLDKPKNDIGSNQISRNRRRNSCALSIGSIFVVLLMVSTAVSAQAKDTERALKLKQKHNYWGETETIISFNGVRINNKGRMKYSLVARAPQWKVVVFRDDDKTFISQSLQQFERTGLISELVVKKYPRALGAQTRTRKNGDLTTLIYSEPFVQMEILPLKNIATAPVEAILYAAYKLPTNGGIPIRYTKFNGRFNTTTNPRVTHTDYLTTTKIEHIEFASKLFEVPRGYTRCKSMQEVLLSKISREASGDFDELFEIKDRTKGQ